MGWGGVFSLGQGDITKAYADVRNNSRVLVFKLGSNAELPGSAVYQENIVAPPEQTATPEQIAPGKTLFNQYCAACHGVRAIGGGLIQDIRYGGALHSPELWNQVVLDGLFATKGMAGFSSVLNQQQAAQIRAYVIDVAQEDVQLKK